MGCSICYFNDFWEFIVGINNNYVYIIRNWISKVYMNVGLWLCWENLGMNLSGRRCRFYGLVSVVGRNSFFNVRINIRLLNIRFC